MDTCVVCGRLCVGAPVRPCVRPCEPSRDPAAGPQGTTDGGERVEETHGATEPLRRGSRPRCSLTEAVDECGVDRVESRRDYMLAGRARAEFLRPGREPGGAAGPGGRGPGSEDRRVAARSTRTGSRSSGRPGPWSARRPPVKGGGGQGADATTRPV